MAYKEYSTVVDGAGKQIDAIITAVEQAQNGTKNPPEEIDQLIDALTQAGEICGRIERKAEQEPDEETTTSDDAE